jgi:Arc/MetJ family transcription regulator
MVVYVSRTNIDIDDELIGWVMRRYSLHTKREAVDYALRRLRVEPMSLEEALAMEGAGWDGDLEAMRAAEAAGMAKLHQGMAEAEAASSRKRPARSR